ncbi:MAG: toxin TumE [Caldilineaceae bacterium]
MNLRTYFERLQNTLFSRRDITIEHLEVILADADAYLEASIRFHDQSVLVFSEEVELTPTKRIRRISYAFHYQSNANVLLFRYDNSPHHPYLATFPAHKHVGNEVIAAESPDLADVLKEIETIIYVGTDDQS